MMKLNSLTLLLTLLSSVRAFAPPRPATLHPTLVLAAENESGGFFGKIKSAVAKRPAAKTTSKTVEEKKTTTTTSFFPKQSGTGPVNEAMNVEAAMMDEKDAKADQGENKITAGFNAIKEAGKAGSISLFLWEAVFWILAVPICAIGYRQTTGHFPDFTDSQDMAILGGEVFAFANAARFALPLRIALAVASIPWCQENIVDRFFPDKDSEQDQA